jgi:hypothetical protein
METIAVLFVLALIAIAGGWYSDSVLTRAEITPHADPISVAVTIGLHG